MMIEKQVLETTSIYLQKPWLKNYPEGVPATIEIPEKSLCAVFDEAVEAFADKPAIMFYGTTIKYSQLKEAVNRFANALVNLGVKKGDKVALFLLNSPQYIIAYFGALKAGAVITPVSPVYTSGELKHQLEDSQAKHIVCQDILYDNLEKTGLFMQNVIITGIDEYLSFIQRLFSSKLTSKAQQGQKAAAAKMCGQPGFHSFQELLKKYAPEAPQVKINPKEDLAALPYTGGTTAHPKGVMLTHENILACQTQVSNYWPFVEKGTESVVAFLPLYHIYGQVAVMINGILQGSKLILFTTPDIEKILYSMEKYQASIFFGVPSLYELLKNHEKTNQVNWKRLKVMISGADTLQKSTVDDWQRRTGSNITEGYGMTETSGVSHANPFDRVKVGSFGVPIPNVTAAIIDAETNQFLPVGETGEMVLCGPNIMQGYWQREEDNQKIFVDIAGQRWMKTGDLVKMDEEGYFIFYDRSKDLIKYRGYSVFAREIEDVLHQHPMIKAAGVIGVPDPKVGQNIKANVVLQPEARGKVSEEEIINYCKERLTFYKVPKFVEFRGELPKTDVGKVSRRELRDELEEV